jgi:hypothetical protein
MGEEDIGEDIVSVRILAVPGVVGSSGLRGGRGLAGVRSDWGMGRRRLRIEEAAVPADMGSVTTLWRGGVGRFGGEGGGECW